MKVKIEKLSEFESHVNIPKYDMWNKNSSNKKHEM